MRTNLKILRLLIWRRQIIRPPNIYNKRCIKNELNEEEVEIMYDNFVQYFLFSQIGN
jgi:hypothetical protein